MVNKERDEIEQMLLELTTYAILFDEHLNQTEKYKNYMQILKEKVKQLQNEQRGI